MNAPLANYGTVLPPTAVEAVVLFGSRARGDADDASDTDICVFAVAEDLEDLVRAKDACTGAYAGERQSTRS